MASNTTGERRWGSARRGGMTVLGKVAVPKPINLPSQRLENHGLDPGVEIVPKGSLSWGTRSSSSGSNPWGSSSGVSRSPNHLSGRPSSSGGTRPSTAGSEDTSSNAWVANSRPSSASGILAANTSTLAALRPHSAETRPGSSQLSRFAEPLSEGKALRGASGAVDNLGIAAPSNNAFSLISGDFPTLGEEKVSVKNTESLDCNSHGSPGSSRPSTTTENMEAAPGVQAEDTSQPTDVKSSLASSWENDVPHPGMERWHRDSYSYPNHNIPPHPYESWRGGTPANPPGGVWFRGPPGAPPYGTPPMAAPGGFPMEPFPYYCPPVPAPGLANAQTVPSHGARPSGPHSKTGDLCRPYMDPFMRPGMPMRPGFYPGYYGQPMGFCSPNERDFSLMGRPPGPPVINRNAPEPIPPRLLDPRPTAPVKQIMGWDKNIKKDHFGHKFTENAHPHDKGHGANASSRDNVWSEDQRKDKQMNRGKRSLHSEQVSILIEGKADSADPAFVKLNGNTNITEAANVSQVVENLARDQTLIQKIEVLNAKARASDGRHDFSTEEPNGRAQAVKSDASVNEAGAIFHLERHYPSGISVPVSRDRTILADNKGFGCTAGGAITTVSRNSSHNLRGRGGQGNKGRFNSQEPDGWRKRSATVERKEQQSTEMSILDADVKDSSKLSMVDPCIDQEATKQRAIQLQKEERIREQKAKAFAKLAELNERSANQGKETSRQKMDDIPSHPDSFQKQQESKIKVELQFGSFQSGEIDVALASGYNPSKIAQSSGSNVSSGFLSSHNQQIHQEDSVLPQVSLQAADDAQNNDIAVYDTFKQKGAAYKKKNSAQSGKNLVEKPTVPGKDKKVNGKGVSSCSESNLPVDLPTVSDSSLHPKRKNKADKNKHMVNESISISSVIAQKEVDVSRAVEQKSRRSDNVVWAPVKSHAKLEVPDGNDQKAEEYVGPLNKNVNAVPSGSKGRRAEIERYVPKAAIKELAQQGSDHLPTSPLKEKSIPDGTIIQGRLSSQTTERIKSTAEPRQAENKTKKCHPQISTESNVVQVLGDSSLSMTGPTQNSQISDGGYQTQKRKEPSKGSVTKPVPQSVEVHPSKRDDQRGKQQIQPPEVVEDNAVDGWVIYDEPVSSGTATIISSMEGHGKSTKGKKNPFKGNKGSKNHQDIERESHVGAKGDAVYFSEARQAERPRSSKEHRGGQWQPRPQAHVTNRHENHTHGRQSVTDEGDKFYKREGSKDAGSQPKQNYSASESRDVSRAHMGRQESKASPENRAYSRNENSVDDVESAPLTQEDWSNNDQRPSSSGNRWNGNNNVRSTRGREFHGARNFIPQENRHNYVPSHREKQNQNSHYEYQPVGPPYNRNKRGDYSERRNENQHTGSKFRDQGHGSHLRRGGASFSGWQRVTNQSDVDYE